MPIVHIDLLEGRPVEYRAAVLKAVRGALVDTVDATHERIVQRVREVGPGCMDVRGKSDRVLVIEVTLLEGRSAEKKAAFYDDVRKRLAEAPGIPPEDVYLIIRDAPRGDLCLGAPLGAL